MKGKLGVVVRREFVSTVFRKGWIIGTLAMPLIFVIYGLVASVPVRIAAKREARPQTAGIVDLAGVVRLEPGTSVATGLPEEAEEILEMVPATGPGADALKMVLGNIELRSLPDEAAGMKALESGEIAVLAVDPADYMTSGTVTSYRLSEGLFDKGIDGRMRETLRRLLVRSLLGEKIEPEVRERVLAPVKTISYQKGRDGSWEKTGLLTILKDVGIPFAFCLLLMIALLSNSATLLQGISEEKENRVIEIILSSVDARTLLIGKLLGLGAAGLLQLAIWLAMAVVPALMLLAGLVLKPSLVVLCLAFFVLGFLLFGTLMTTTGVLGTNSRESQQYGMFWSITSVIPFMLFSLILDEPNGTAARVLTYIPFTAPVTMMLRLGSGEVPWWEIAVSLAVLAGAFWLALRLSGKIFRTALLMYGKRPGLFEIFRWLREA